MPSALLDAQLITISHGLFRTGRYVVRWFLGTLVALLAGLVIYFGSAVASLNALIEAARVGDAAAVLARTDTVRLRRSLVDQIVSAYLAQMGQNRPVKPLERLAANTYGASIADAMIGKILTPDNLTSILNRGEIEYEGAMANMSRLTDINTSSLFETVRRISPVKPVEFAISFGDADRAGGISMHFEGDQWKLSGIMLPASTSRMLAQNLAHSRAGKG